MRLSRCRRLRTGLKARATKGKPAEAGSGWRAVALFLLLLLAACAPDRPGAGLEPLPVPARLEELDPPVREQYTELRSTLDELLQSSAADAELAAAHGRLGMWHQAYGDLELARLAYRHARTLAPEEDRWLYYLGVVDGETGDTQAARDALEAFLERRPGDPPALVRLAEAEVTAGRAGDARRLYQRALAAEPQSPRTLAGLGRLALQERDFETAARHLEAALELDPGAARIHYSLGLAYRGLGRREEAAEHMARGSDRHGTAGAGLDDPLMAEVLALKRGSRLHGRRGSLAFAGGEFARAVEQARKAVAANPADATGHLNLGAALLRAGDAEAALAPIEQALLLAPGHPTAHFNLGAALYSLGRLEDAETEYRAAVAANPGYKQARYNLANLLRRRGAAEAALAEYRRVIELDPGLALARLFRTVCLGALGRWREAEAALARDLADLPQAPVLRLLAVRLRATAGDAAERDGEEALALAREMHRRRPALAAAEALAAAHAELGDFHRAAAWQEAALAAARDVAGGPVLARLSRRLAGYGQRQPCRELWTDSELRGRAIPVAAPAGG